MNRSNLLAHCLAVLGLAVCPVAWAHTAPAAPLVIPLAERVAAFDTAFFTAFNTCDIARLARMSAPNLEFFHDLGGTQRSRAEFIASVKQKVCGKFTRELVKASFESWALGNEGAIYSGTHRFRDVGKSACQGQGRFLHVLDEQGGQLVVTRAVSYDHREIAKENNSGQVARALKP